MNNKSIITLILFFAYFSLNSMQRLHEHEPQQRVDTRKIAILGWGSLPNDLGDLDIKGSFQKSTLKWPIQLARLSGKGTTNQRVTRIYDREEGQPISLWYAESAYKLLPTARLNLTHREKMPETQQGGPSSNIFYIKTLLPNRRPDNNEHLIKDRQDNSLRGPSNNLWYIVDGGDMQLTRDEKVELANWATQNGYTAVIWTGLGKTPGYDSLNKLKALLRRDNGTLSRTKNYIEILPDRNELTDFEKDIKDNIYG